MKKQATKQNENMNEILSALRPVTQAKPERFMRQQSAYNIYSYWAMAGADLENHLAPVFWLQLGSKLNPLDEIVITEELGAWRARLLVRSVGPNGVDLIVLNENEIGGTAPLGGKTPFKDGPRVEYRGAHLLWSVFDGDRELIAGLKKESDAIEWLQNNNIGGVMA